MGDRYTVDSYEFENVVYKAARGNETVELAADQGTIEHGQALGQNLTTGKYHVYDKDANDGTEVIKRIYTGKDSIDTTGEVKNAQVNGPGEYKKWLIKGVDFDTDIKAPHVMEQFGMYLMEK